jgi:putative zinc finger/helix-turn-helix YgiT family protein
MSCCIKCRKAELKEQNADLPATVKGESVLVLDFPALVCTNCSYKTIRGSDMPEFMRAASDLYRQKHQLLPSGEIRIRRERVDMSQAEFASFLGVGVASIKRWEMGQIQDRAMDRLIRISTDVTEAYHNYKQVERLVAPQGFWAPTGNRTWADDETDVSETQWQKPNLPSSLTTKSKAPTFCS